MNRELFDDIVEDKKCGDWSQMCNSCVQAHKLNHEDLDRIPSDDFVCGIKGCENEAHFYVKVD